MKKVALSLLLGTLGLAACVALVTAFDERQIGAAIAAAGWGVAWLGLWRMLPIACDTLGWRVFLPAGERPSFRFLWAARWVGESVNTLLPVGQVGGDLARARLVALAGVPAGRAGASVAADFTVGLGAQLVFTLFGLGLLAAVAGGGKVEFAAPIAGLAFAVALVWLFYRAQSRGLAGLAGRLPERWRHRLDGMVEPLGEAYADRGAVLACGAWRLWGWFVRAGETWLILLLLGVEPGLAEVLILESLSYAVRSAAFAVPGALGAQEGGLLALGLLVGLSPETALALALIKRLRELVVGLPGIALWLWVEARSATGKSP